MPHFFRKFRRSDVYINTIKTYPEVKFSIYGGAAYYNNAPIVSGAFTGSVLLSNPSGAISLYEMNVDRFETEGQAFGPNNVENNNLVRPWVSKDGSRMAFRTTAKAGFNAASVGDIMYSTFPLTASIKKDFYASSDARSVAPSFTKSGGTGIAVSANGSVTRILALKNTINYYNYVNPEFAYSNTARNFDSVDVGLISVPSIFYGSRFKKGTINLKFYYTGSLFAQARDTAQNGVLYETMGPRTGSPIGLVLYREGMIILTGAYDLASGGETDLYQGAAAGQKSPKWVYFGAGAQQAGVSPPYSSFLMEMSGTADVQTVTMFATAPKGQLNHSNNPSYVQFSTASHVTTGSHAYLQDQKRVIKNIVSSSYITPTASFQKTTYISKIGIYDENENLIAIAKPATPIKKEADRDFTFKLKIDI